MAAFSCYYLGALVQTHGGVRELHGLWVQGREQTGAHLLLEHVLLLHLRSNHHWHSKQTLTLSNMYEDLKKCLHLLDYVIMRQRNYINDNNFCIYLGSSNAEMKEYCFFLTWYMVWLQVIHSLLVDVHHPSSGFSSERTELSSAARENFLFQFQDAPKKMKKKKQQLPVRAKKPL